MGAGLPQLSTEARSAFLYAGLSRLHLMLDMAAPGLQTTRASTPIAGAIAGKLAGRLPFSPTTAWLFTGSVGAEVKRSQYRLLTVAMTRTAPRWSNRSQLRSAAIAGSGLSLSTPLSSEETQNTTTRQSHWPVTWTAFSRRHSNRAPCAHADLSSALDTGFANGHLGRTRSPVQFLTGLYRRMILGIAGTGLLDLILEPCRSSHRRI